MKAKFTNSVLKIYGVIKILAPVGFILSIIFFVISTNNARRSSTKLIGNLMQIEQSISTRHLGIFPDYLPQINELFMRTETGDSVIIFQDVLYYGLFFNPAEFKKMLNHIVDLSNKGHNITIAYYGVDTRMFREVVNESRIAEKYLNEMSEAKIKLLRDSTWMPNVKGSNKFLLADSIVSEQYFAKTKEDNLQDFKNKIADFTTPLYVKQSDDMLFCKIDSIRNRALNKPVEKITFYDFFNMYKNISNEIATCFKTTYNTRIKLIPLNNYLVLSCWSNEKEVLFSLPGKFAADEIGFISHDVSIQNYIKKQLDGAIIEVKNK